MFGMELNRLDGVVTEADACRDPAILSYGLKVGTRVASSLGWRAIDALAVGDKVLTFDHGMQEITGIKRGQMWYDTAEVNEAFWPVVIPVGALGNRRELIVPPDQGVMVESDASQEEYGDPFSILTASSLFGLRGIYRCPPLEGVEMTSVYFERDEVIYVEGGTLIHCPQDMSTLDQFLYAGKQTYYVISGEKAELLADSLYLEDEMAKLKRANM